MEEQILVGACDREANGNFFSMVPAMLEALPMLLLGLFGVGAVFLAETLRNKLNRGIVNAQDS